MTKLFVACMAGHSVDSMLRKMALVSCQVPLYLIPLYKSEDQAFHAAQEAVGLDDVHLVERLRLDGKTNGLGQDVYAPALAFSTRTFPEGSAFFYPAFLTLGDLRKFCDTGIQFLELDLTLVSSPSDIPSRVKMLSGALEHLIKRAGFGLN